MKTIVLIIIVVGISTSTFAQEKKPTPSKEETQQWIIEKIRQYSYESIEGDVIHKYGISYKDDILFIDQKTQMILPQGTQELHGIKEVPIKQIESFSFKDKSTNYWLTINMKDGANVIISKFDGLPTELKSSVEIILSKSLDSENLKERMLKALNYLVEIHTEKKKKEPF